MNTNKVYVDVAAVFSKEGQLKPVSVIWQDGTFMRFNALQISGVLLV